MNNFYTKKEANNITLYIRWSRIFKHLFKYVFTKKIDYWYEIQHYFYMKKFSNIN